MVFTDPRTSKERMGEGGAALHFVEKGGMLNGWEGWKRAEGMAS